MDADSGSDNGSDGDSDVQYASAESAVNFLRLDDDAETFGNRLRVTGLFVTINTNQSSQTITVDMFKKYLEDVLFQKAALVTLLHISERDLVKIHVVGAGVEVGERMKRTHCHFNLYITHTTKILLSKGTQRRWQNFIQMTLPVYTPNVYVNIILLDTRRENYALKNQYVLND